MERGERILDYEVPDTKEFCEDQCIVMAMMASGQCKADFIPLESSTRSLIDWAQWRYLIGQKWSPISNAWKQIT